MKNKTEKYWDFMCYEMRAIRIRVPERSLSDGSFPKDIAKIEAAKAGSFEWDIVRLDVDFIEEKKQVETLPLDDDGEGVPPVDDFWVEKGLEDEERPPVTDWKEKG